MPRRTPAPGDEPLQMDLDTGFTGVNDRLDASLLKSGHAFYDLNQQVAQPGLMKAAINVRFSRGQAETRPGVVQPPWFQPPVPYTSLAGAGILSAPNGLEWMLACDATAVYALADGHTPRRMALPSGTVLDTPTEVVQAFQNIILLRGLDREPLQWDGNPAQPFRLVSSPAPDYSGESPRYLSPTPRAEWGIVAGDRLWVPVGVDSLAYSDLLEYDKFDLTLNVVRINQGEDDRIVAAASHERSVIVWKAQSIYRLDGVFGLLTQMELVKINKELGCIARNTVCQVGGDFLWLASGGVYRLTDAFETRQRAVPTPVSESFSRTFDRINWLHAHKASAVLVDRYYYLSVPLDGADYCNSLLVLDVLSGEWQGVDIIARPPVEAVAEVQPENTVLSVITSYGPETGTQLSLTSESPAYPDVATLRLLRTDYSGKKTAFLIDRTRVLALGHGRMNDHIDGRLWPIYTRMDTRGYVMGQMGFKSFTGITASYAQQNGALQVTALTEGVKEEQLLQRRRAVRRTRYRISGKRDWNPTNAADDFDAPHREDYTFYAADASQLRSGIPITLEQEYTSAWPVRLRGRYMAVRFESWGAHFILKTLSADGRGERNQLHPKSS